jgi:hypothetical protein
METTNAQITTPANDSSSCHHVRRSPGWLGGWRGLAVAAAVAAAIGAIALNQHWLAVASLVPLLYVLPCAVMMFACMKSMNHGQADTTQASGHAQTTPAVGPNREQTLDTHG